MPPFDFCNEDSNEFKFSGGKYALRSFDATTEVPQIDLFSKQDIKLMRMEHWALVAEVEDPERYKEEVNILLLSFRIYKLARVFIKYRLCKEDTRFCFRPYGAERHNCAKDQEISCNPAPMSIVFSVSECYNVVNLDNGARNGYIK